MRRSQRSIHNVHHRATGKTHQIRNINIKATFILLPPCLLASRSVPIISIDAHGDSTDKRDTYRIDHFELAPSQSSAINLVLAPVIPSISDHPAQSLEGATWKTSSHGLTGGRPNLNGPTTDAYRYWLVGTCLAFPLALAVELMVFLVVDEEGGS